MYLIGGCEIQVVQGDITDMDTQAIVNAANSQLVLGAGVAGAIRTKGGPSIQAECNKIGGCRVGGAALTGAGNLKADYVIHAVGPRYGVDADHEAKLRLSVISCLKICENNNIKSVSFPAISTGVFGYPLEEAAEAIIDEIINFAGKQVNILERIVLCLFTEKDYYCFEDILKSKIEE